jgi:hypothetical protein
MKSNNKQYKFNKKQDNSWDHFSSQNKEAHGCKQDILYIFIILFSIWKHKKKVFQTSNLPLAFQNKWFFFS